MTTTPDSSEPSQDQDVAAEAEPKEGAGVEIGMSPPGEGSTFEPEEDSGA
jgi:hypothetical protein